MPGQSDTPYGSEPVALLSAREALALYDALAEANVDPDGPEDWNANAREVYAAAWLKLCAAASEASA